MRRRWKPQYSECNHRIAGFMPSPTGLVSSSALLATLVVPLFLLNSSRSLLGISVMGVPDLGLGMILPEVPTISRRSALQPSAFTTGLSTITGNGSRLGG